MKRFYSCKPYEVPFYELNNNFIENEICFCGLGFDLTYWKNAASFKCRSCGYILVNPLRCSYIYPTVVAFSFKKFYIECVVKLRNSASDKNNFFENNYVLQMNSYFYDRMEVISFTYDGKNHLPSILNQMLAFSERVKLNELL